MPRIPEAVIQEREEAIQKMLEDAHPEGLSINQLVEKLKEAGISLPKSEYQAVHIVLKNAEKEGVVLKEKTKWSLTTEDEITE